MQWQTLFRLIAFIALCQNGIDAIRSVTCEGETAYLSCEPGLGFIKVNSANYGRTASNICTNVRSHLLSNTRCIQPTSLHTVSERCNGMSKCDVPATNYVFSDPCFGTHKYLDVSFTCLPATEGNHQQRGGPGQLMGARQARCDMHLAGSY